MICSPWLPARPGCLETLRMAVRAQLKKRMDLCWLEMTETELNEPHLVELSAIYDELSGILGKYGVGAVHHG